MSQTIKLPRKLTMKDLDRLPRIEVGEEQNSPILSEDTPAIRLKLEVCTEGGQDRNHRHSFICRYLLLKINSLLEHKGAEWHPFLNKLIPFYNNYLTNPSSHNFRVSTCNHGLVAQILLASQTYVYLTVEMLEELLGSSGMVVTTLVQSYFRVKQFLPKSQYVVAMSLVSLYARTNPFRAIVHKDKNHQGEIDFAAVIFDYIQIDQTAIKPTNSLVQDAYSLRCTPQVHGVLYDCLKDVEQQIPFSINKPQMRYISINGSAPMRNLCFRDETETMLLDRLVCALNELGHMSFLRTQRLLNKFLTKNNLPQSEFYDLLMIRLKRVSPLVGQDKNIAFPTNAETVIMDNYKHDIYVDTATPLFKTMRMLRNISQLMSLEMQTFMQVLPDTYKGVARIFLNSEVEALYRKFEPLVGEFNKLGHVIEEWMASDVK